MKIIGFFLFVTFVGCIEWLSGFNVELRRTEALEDEANAIIETSDGGFAITGKSGATQGRGIVAKYRKNATLEWMMSFRNPLTSNPMYLNAIKQHDTGYVAVGRSTETNGLGLIMNLDMNGNVTWARRLMGFATAFNEFKDVEVVSDGFVATGNIATTASHDGMFLGKWSRNGTMVWKKYYSSTILSDSTINSMKATNDGFILVGKDTNAVFMKTDLYGDVIWAKQLPDEVGELNGVDEITEGNYIATGSVGATPDLIIVKFTDSGSVTYIRKIAGGSPLQDVGRSISVISDGSYVISGVVGGLFSGPYAAKISADGDTKHWMYRSDTVGVGYSASKTSDGGVLTAGWIGRTGPRRSMWVLKYFSNGTTCDNSSSGIIDDNLNSFSASVSNLAVTYNGSVSSDHSVFIPLSNLETPYIANTICFIMDKEDQQINCCSAGMGMKIFSFGLLLFIFSSILI